MTLPLCLMLAASPSFWLKNCKVRVVEKWSKEHYEQMAKYARYGTADDYTRFSYFEVIFPDGTEIHWPLSKAAQCYWLRRREVRIVKDSSYIEAATIQLPGARYTGLVSYSHWCYVAAHWEFVYHLEFILPDNKVIRWPLKTVADGIFEVIE